VRNGRAALLAVGAGLLVISTLAFFRVPVLPEIGAELGLGPVALGGITMAFALGRLAIDLPAGRLADRVSPAWLYVGAGLLMGVGSGVLAGAEGVAAAWGGAFVIGSASSLANTTGMVFFARSAGVGARGRALAVFSSGLLIGQTAGPAIAGAIAQAGDWRVAQRIAAVVALAVAAAFLALIAARPRAAAAALAPGRPPPTAATDAAEPPRRDLLVLYGTSFSVFFTLAAVPQTLVPLIGADALDLGPAAIGLALGAGGACRIAGAVAGGQVADRVGRKPALVPGMALMAAGVAVLALPGGTALWVAAIVLTSLGSIGVAVSATMVADHGGGPSGRLLGRFRFVGDLGLLVGPLVATALYDLVGRGAPLLLNAALLAGFTVACALLLTETHPTSRAGS
jgi:MFS family permease